jgi:hypothetical protein
MAYDAVQRLKMAAWWPVSWAYEHTLSRCRCFLSSFQYRFTQYKGPPNEAFVVLTALSLYQFKTSA